MPNNYDHLPQELYDQKLGHYCLPRDLAEFVNTIVGGKFEVDICAHPEAQFIKADKLVIGSLVGKVDGMCEDWGATTFVNPPGLVRPPKLSKDSKEIITPNYPLHPVRKWMETCVTKFNRKGSTSRTIMMYSQVRIGTPWYVDSVATATCVLELRSRVRCCIPLRDSEGSYTGMKTMTDPKGGSVIVLWTTDTEHLEMFRKMGPQLGTLLTPYR